MTAFVQWIHISAAVIGVGGMAFMLFVLLPALNTVNDEQRAILTRRVAARFRWVSWTAILVLIASGLANIRLRAWEAPWGPYWKALTIKIVLAFAVFIISLMLTLPIPALDRMRARRKMWLSAAFGIALGVILISAYLRGF